MALMTWTEQYSVGFAEIDEQHQQLVALLNELHTAMLEGRSREATRTTLYGLIDYTNQHFAHEEELFVKYSYPSSFAHKAQHADLRVKTLDLKAQFDSGVAGVSSEVMGFLVAWLSRHILGEDKAYVPYLKSKGLN